MRVLAHPQRGIQSAEVRSGFLGFSPSGGRVRKFARFNQNKSACRRFDLAYTKIAAIYRKTLRIKIRSREELLSQLPDQAESMLARIEILGDSRLPVLDAWRE